MTPALLVIDLQKAYYNEQTSLSMEAAAEQINKTLPIFRGCNLPVVWVQHVDEADDSVPGKSGFDLINNLSPAAEEYRIRKTYRNSFNKTKLLEILSSHDIDTVIITGYCAEYCIQGTSIGAMDHDIMPILLDGGIASGSFENLACIYRINMNISIEKLNEILN